MKQYEARPTEYNGIVFRSKSEAIIARGFDISGAIWQYEPSVTTRDGENIFTDGYNPDFFVVKKDDSEKNCIWQFFVEYKPKKPNSIYIKQLYTRFKKLENINTSAFCIMLCGSPFDIDNGFHSYEIFRGCELSEFGKEAEFMYNHIEEAKKYRFDL